MLQSSAKVKRDNLINFTGKSASQKYHARVSHKAYHIVKCIGSTVPSVSLSFL